MKNVCAIVLLEQNLQKTNITIMSEHKKNEKKTAEGCRHKQEETSKQTYDHNRCDSLKKINSNREKSENR